MIGSFGPIVFEASTEMVLTFSDLSSRRKLRLAEHPIIGKKPRIENLGPDLSTKSLSIRLDKQLGLDPLGKLAEMIGLCIRCERHPLIIGPQVIGFYVVESMSETFRNIDARGEVGAIDVQLELKEDPYDD